MTLTFQFYGPIHVSFCIVWGDWRHSFLISILVFSYSSTICWRQSFMPWIIFVPLLRISWESELVISVSELCSVPSICMSVLISVLHCLDYCSFIISLIQVMQVLYLVLFFKIVLVFLGPLPFHMNFKISLSPFFKRLVMIFIGITLNLYIVISAILSLSNPCIWHISPFF